LEFEEFITLAAKFIIEEDAEAMEKELREAFRLYDKEGMLSGFITEIIVVSIMMLKKKHYSTENYISKDHRKMIPKKSWYIMRSLNISWVLTAVTFRSAVLWVVMSRSSGTDCVHTVDYCLSYSSALKMEAICSSEMSGCL
jgi:hypothetical protein